MNSPRMLALVIACAAACTPLLATDAVAQGRAATGPTKAEMHKTIELVMDLAGTMDISAEGAVDGLTLDPAIRIDPALLKNVNSLVAGWRFSPVLKEGVAVPVRTPLRMRLLAQQAGDANLTVSISSVRFSDHERKDTDALRRADALSPRYPVMAVRREAEGEVSLLMRIGRDGKPMDVAVERVNLGLLVTDKQMQALRAAFGEASLKAAERWTFHIPTTGPDADAPFWTIRVPVNFQFSDSKKTYGHWHAYVPGPKAAAPWHYEGKGSKADSSDLLAEGGVYMAGVSEGPELLTPLGP